MVSSPWDETRGDPGISHRQQAPPVPRASKRPVNCRGAARYESPTRSGSSTCCARCFHPFHLTSLPLSSGKRGGRFGRDEVRQHGLAHPGVVLASGHGNLRPNANLYSFILVGAHFNVPNIISLLPKDRISSHPVRGGQPLSRRERGRGVRVVFAIRTRHAVSLRAGDINVDGFMRGDFLGTRSLTSR